MKIAVIGTGYVGLVSGVCLSEFGQHVTCVDKHSQKIALLQQHVMPIYEPGLEQMVESNRKAGRLSFSTDLKQAVANADLVMIAVGTPPDENDGMPDMRAFDAAAEEVAKALSNYTVVVTKSTVPIGTNRSLAKRISSLNPNADFDVVSNPEFLREGSAIKDFMSPDRIVAGVDSKRSRDVIAKLYEPICLNGAQLFFTTFESSELVKYASNCMLAARVAFINEMADICEKTGANIRDVARGIGMDSRIGDQFLRPGPGFGGSCFPKDALALQQMAKRAGCHSLMIDAMIDGNEERKKRMADKISMACGGNIKDQTIAILGLTFKPGTDDMRESPSLVILPSLLEKGAKLKAYDPEGMKEAAKNLPAGITFANSAYDAMKDADALVILTEWNEFRSLDMKQVKSLLKKPLVIDLRNIYKRQDMQKYGFHYVSIGRQDVVPGQPWIADLNIDDEKAA
ncbi:MAG: UDP-glucose/GDP-mannose dehydrogenase family protein [Rickettsiales bacterium]|jgi:UDPglucose 6-dehydrogenase|nr:UDP-glucose/GDP-mannose dehydrogenase family protein [Rickettsiales bacterium]